MAQEIYGGGYGKVVKIDNQAAVQLMREPSGGWRTRHLRLRAAHMRWRLGRADWLLEAISGNEQTADIGTRPMTAPKLLEMRRMLGIDDLGAIQRPEEGTQEKIEKEQGQIAEEVRRKALLRAQQMIQIAVLLDGVTAAKGDEGNGWKKDESDWFFILILILAGIGLFTLLHGLWALYSCEVVHRAGEGCL